MFRSQETASFIPTKRKSMMPDKLFFSDAEKVKEVMKAINPELKEMLFVHLVELKYENLFHVNESGEGSTAAWKVDKQRAERCQYIVLCCERDVLPSLKLPRQEDEGLSFKQKICIARNKDVKFLEAKEIEDLSKKEPNKRWEGRVRIFFKIEKCGYTEKGWRDFTDDRGGSGNPKKITYKDLKNNRQREIYNFQKLSAVLAEYGFNCIKLPDDWEGADFLAYHMIEKEKTLMVQLKGELTIAEKYRNKNLYIAFPVRKSMQEDSWYLVPHDTLMTIVKCTTNWLNTPTWKKWGSYNSPLSKAMQEHLKEYRLCENGEQSPNEMP